LDLAKAFDKLNRHALFIKLMNRKCPFCLISILDCWFAKIYSCVKWGECMSEFVCLRCGTRQGGVASPTLFSVCINDVIELLQKSSLGCHIRNISFNAFMYADDLLLLSISVGDLQGMINVCKSELEWLDMAINSKKSNCIRVGKRFDEVTAQLFFDRSALNWCTELPYLGVVIKSAKVFKCSLHVAKTKFYRSLNGILGKVGSTPPISVTLSLIASHCNPILLYGLEALCLTKADITSLSHPYNSAYMKLFATFNKTVITLCQFHSGHFSLDYLLDLRTLLFYSKLCTVDYSASSILYSWFGLHEFFDICSKYNISEQAHPLSFKPKIWESFAMVANALECS
jgi:hypothetical protein